MRLNPRRWIFKGVSVGVLATVMMIGWSVARGYVWQQVEPHSLIPRQTFLYVEFKGESAAGDAYKETAEYKAFVESGLSELFQKTVEFAIKQDNTGQARKARQAFQEVLDNGYVIAASLPNEQGPPIPSTRIIFREAGNWATAAADLLKNAASREVESLEQTQIRGRQVTRFVIPQSPGIEVGLWKEGAHLVVAIGPDAVQETLACAEGDAPSLKQHEQLQEVLAQETDFADMGTIWFDFPALQKRYGNLPLPLPTSRPLAVNDVVKFLGLDNLTTVTSRMGYRGESQWSETKVMGLGKQDGPMMTLKDLPPLPSQMNWFQCFQWAPAKSYDQLLKMAREGSGVVGLNEQAQVEQMIEAMPQMLGFDPKTELIDHLGNIVCLYDDANGGVFGSGFTLTMKLKNPAKVEDFIDSQMNRLERMEKDGQSPDIPVYPFRVRQDGEDLIVFDIYGDNDEAVQYGALKVVDDWLVVALMPQSVEAFELRLAGNLPVWKPDAEYQAAFEDLPQEFTSLTAVNTRDTYQLLLNWFTTFLPMIQQFALNELADETGELPFYVEDFPPAEQVTAPLFPNVAMSVAGEDGMTFYSRSSTIGVPMMGGNSNMSSAAAVGVGVALLLPAVQQARFAARSTQSKNNLKQMGLAMHNYHDTFNHFPTATIPNSDLKPEKRLSWTVQILPYLEQAAIYERIDQKAAWNAEANEMMVQTSIPIFIDPNYGESEEEYPVIHYAAIAGTGKDAPTLKIGEPGCGIFGYDRETSFRDITDGTSNTMMITQVNKDFGPWAQGGPSTLRSLTKKPYINGPDGIGGPRQDSVQVLMSDGSVRTISANIDPEVFEHLAEMADGQVVGEF